MRKLLSIAISLMVLYVPKEKYQTMLDTMPSVAERATPKTSNGWQLKTCASKHTGLVHSYFVYPASRSDAEILLCLHGFNTDGSIFFNLANLADWYTIIAYNFPDRTTLYNGSLGDFNQIIDDFCDVMQIDTMALLGNSIGGAIAIKYAGTPHKTIVSRLILTSTNIFGTTKESIRQMQGMADRLLKYPDYKLYYLLVKGEKILNRLEGSKFLRDTPGNTVAIKHVAWYRQILKSLYNYNGTDDAQNITCPIIAFHGSDDTMLPLKNAANIPTIISHASFNVIEGGGHSIVYHQPDYIAKIVREHRGK